MFRVTLRILAVSAWIMVLGHLSIFFIDGNEMMTSVLFYKIPLHSFLFSERYAQKWCSLLSDPKGVFAPCHKEISPDVYKKVSLKSSFSAHDLFCLETDSFQCGFIWTDLRI